MASPSKAKQPLSERSSNLPSPIKSPSKIPLPPSPMPQKLVKQEVKHAQFAQQDGAMSPVFKAEDVSQAQKPALVRTISDAHTTGQTYVSPSDDILSPTTKKLSEVKGRRFGNFKKSSSLYTAHNLFAKSRAKNDNTQTPFRDE